MQIKFVLFFMLMSIVDARGPQRTVDIQRTAFFITVSVGGGERFFLGTFYGLIYLSFS